MAFTNSDLITGHKPLSLREVVASLLSRAASGLKGHPDGHLFRIRKGIEKAE